MHRLLLLFSILLIVSCSQEAVDRDENQNAVYQRARVWHVTDTIVSPVKWSSDSVRQLSLDISSSKLSYLEVNSDAPVYLFYGDKLIKKTANGFLEHSFDDLNGEKVFLSLDQKLQNMSYGIFSFEESKKDIAFSSVEIVKRKRRMISDNVFLILSIFASIFMVIIKVNYDKRYAIILSINKVFSTRLHEGEQSRVRVLDQDNFVFASFYAFLMAGLIYFLSAEGSEAFLGIDAKGMLGYLKLLLFVAIGLIGKVILVSVVSNLFGNYKISAFYIKEMLNINLFFILILFFSTALIYLLEGELPAFWLTAATYSVFGFYVIRLLLLYFKILKLSSFSNLYLFSYFCTTEIFPFLIGLKYFVR